MSTPANPSASNNFFVVGGTLKRDAASYVKRPVDDEILRLTLAGNYCNVLAARQTGKSSLMVRTSERLKEQGVRTVIIDLTSIGSNVSPSEWYFGLLSRLSRELKLGVDENAWWQTRSEQSPVQRFSDFLREVILEEIGDPIVVFVDEIDSTLKLGFTDDFFAAIRAAYNARSNDPAYERLTFVLLGVARPADLIKDRTRTPYNIGISVNVTDFQFYELDTFKSELDQACAGRGGQILTWVLEWTGGQPYLTQKLCAEAVEQSGGRYSEDRLAAMVVQLFLGDKARTETNLRSIQDRINNNPHATKILHIYNRILAGKQILAEERSIEQNELKLAGLVKISSERVLQVRNRIYARVFNTAWVKENTPISKTQRLSVVVSVIAVIAIGVAGYFFYRQQTQAAEIQAATYTESFNTSQSAEVRITALAGLFGLGNEYATQARELFNGLSHADQLALFDLATPGNVGNELLVVVENTYQEQRNTPEGNELLQTMAGVLEQTSAPGATSLTLEINTWLDGRTQAKQGAYDSAITLYTNAWEKSQERGQENPGVLFDRAKAYIILSQYNPALKDLDTVLTLNDSFTQDVAHIILEDQVVSEQLLENKGQYPALVSAVSLSTPTPAPTLSPTSIYTPTPVATAMPEGWLYYDDFEGEEKTYISLEDDPTLVSRGITTIDDNHVYYVDTQTQTTLLFSEILDTTEPLEDYAVQFDMMLSNQPEFSSDDNSWFSVDLRSNRHNDETSYRYYTLRQRFGGVAGYLENFEIHLSYYDANQEPIVLKYGSYDFLYENLWYHIRVEVKDKEFKWYFIDRYNENLYFRYIDEYNRSPSGWPSFSFGPETGVTFYFDNILVKSLK